MGTNHSAAEKPAVFLLLRILKKDSIIYTTYFYIYKKIRS